MAPYINPVHYDYRAALASCDGSANAGAVYARAEAGGRDEGGEDGRERGESIMPTRDIYRSSPGGDVILLLALGVCLGSAQAEAVPREGSLPASARPLTAKTAGEFATDCLSDETDCASVIGKSLMDNMELARALDICLPGADYAHGVVIWLNAHPEAAPMRTEDGIFLALKTIYACHGANDNS
jgi:hypothetical protein